MGRQQTVEVHPLLLEAVFRVSLWLLPSYGCPPTLDELLSDLANGVRDDPIFEMPAANNLKEAKLRVRQALNELIQDGRVEAPILAEVCS